MSYQNKKTATLTNKQERVLETLCEESNTSQTQMFRELIDIAHQAGGVNELRNAVRQYDTGEGFEYNYDSHDGILSREWLTHEYEWGSPLNPEHVDPARMPKQSGDKAAVLHGILIYEHVNVYESQEDNECNDDLLNYIWEYAGMTQHIEDTYTELIGKIERMHGDNDKAIYYKQKYGRSKLDTDTLTTIFENVEEDSMEYCVVHDILQERGELE